MNSRHFNRLQVILFIVLSFVSKAQEKKTYFQAGIKYLTNNVYLGRKDSVALPYITPSFGYHHTSGFYFDVSASYAPVPEASRIDLATIDAGYDFTIGKLDAGLYGSKYFYNDGSFAINAEIGAGMGGYADYDLGALSANAGFDIAFGKDADIIANAGLSHSFTALNEKLEIKPSVLMNAGTKNYFGAYYKSNRHLNIHKKKNQSNSPLVSVLQASQFTILDYELSLPVTYDNHKIKLLFTPTYAIPVNPATIVKGTTSVKEGISNSLYAELEFDYKFR